MPTPHALTRVAGLPSRTLGRGTEDLNINRDRKVRTCRDAEIAQALWSRYTDPEGEAIQALITPHVTGIQWKYVRVLTRTLPPWEVAAAILAEVGPIKSAAPRISGFPQVGTWGSHGLGVSHLDPAGLVVTEERWSHGGAFALVVGRREPPEGEG